MKAGVVFGKEDIRYTDTEIPKIQNPNDVLVKVKYTGICGSDVPRVNLGTSHTFPNILGHEFSGIVEEAGSQVTRVKPGDRVAGVPLVPCFKCEACMKGNYSLCRFYSFIGSRRFGSFAEYVAVPDTNVFPFDETVGFEQGALFEPCTVALHGLRLPGFEGGGSVAVIGAGTVGLFTLQWAKIMGAKRIAAIDIDGGKLPLARRLGATDTLLSTDPRFEELSAEVTEGRGFDYVFDAAGTPETILSALSLAGGRAKICFIGTPLRNVSFTVREWEMLNRKELLATGSWMSYSAPFPGAEWDLTSHFFKTGELKYDSEMIDRIIPLSEIAGAFELFKRRGAVHGKILIDSEA